MKGWKNLNKDLTCRSFQFEIGKEYEHIGEVSLCSAGFHFHQNHNDLFRYYDFDLEKTVIAEVEASGIVEHGDDKSVCSVIKIIKILTDEDVNLLGNLRSNIGWGNTGDRNTGYRNTGDRNTGYRNTGYRNTGDRNTGYRNTGDGNTGDWNTGDGNTGDWNTGDWNKCDYQNGHFNTSSPSNIMVFNKPCNVDAWNSAVKPDFLYFIKTWADIKPNVTKLGIKLLLDLPNFDPIIFEKISGYSVSDLKIFEILWRKF
jgi:hypothetical protein